MTVLLFKQDSTELKSVQEGANWLFPFATDLHSAVVGGYVITLLTLMFVFGNILTIALVLGADLFLSLYFNKLLLKYYLWRGWTAYTRTVYNHSQDEGE